MPISTCIVSGNVKTLLNANVSGAVVKAVAMKPFFHGTTLISGELVSTTTDTSGNFTLTLIETETVGYKINVVIEYYDGIANTKRASYPIVVPNSASANFSDLVTVETMAATSASLAASRVSVTASGNLTSTDAQSALVELQTDIDTRATSASPTLTGSVTFSGLTATTVPYLDASKVLTSSAVTPTELGYLSGVTSAVQTQINTKAPTASPTFTGNATFDTTTLFVDSSNDRVGIGTITPSNTLHVYKSQTTTTTAKIENPNSDPGAGAQFSVVAEAMSMVMSATSTLGGDVGSLLTSSASGGLTVGTFNVGDLRLSTNNTPRLTVGNTGNITLHPLTASTVPYLDGSKVLTSSAVTPTELGYVSGVTSAIQTQINAKAPSASPTFTGSTTFSALTATTVPYLDGSKILTSSAVTPTELGYLSGVTSAIQTQINTKAPTASPTFTGDATFDTTTLFVDSANNRVGIGTITPSYVLDVKKDQPSVTTVRISNSDSDPAAGAQFALAAQAMSMVLSATSSTNDVGSLLTTAASGGLTVGTYDVGSLRLTTANTARVTIDASGNTAFNALTATTVPYLDASKVLTSSAVTPTELGYVSGVTSAIQTQLNAKAPTASPTFTGDATFDTNTLFIDSANDRIGIITTSPSFTVGLGGAAARTISMERNTGGVAGQGLTISSGGAASGGTDLAAGTLTLQAGISTGTGGGSIVFQTPTIATTGTSDNSRTTKLTINSRGNLTSVVENSGSVNPLSITCYGGHNSNLFLTAQGTLASPTKMLSGNRLVGFSGRGYYDNGAGGVGFSGDVARIDFTAGEDFASSTNCGTNMIFSVTPTGSGTIAEAMRIAATKTVSFQNGISLQQVASAAEAATVVMNEKDTTPASPTSGSQAKVYMKSDKLVIQYNDGGTVRYKYLDLTGTGVTWVHDTAAP